MSKPKALLIAEKNSLRYIIEATVSRHAHELPYDVRCFALKGHIFSLLEPKYIAPELASYKWETLPIYPTKYGGWRYTFRSRQEKDIYDALNKEAMSGKYDFIINAGDPDQEGELLVWETIMHLGRRLPVKRFWTNDLTENAVFRALLNLRDDENDPALRNLLSAAFGRQHSDWLYGMNGSRAAGLKMNGNVSVGRVESPMMTIVCKREQEIRDYRPHTVYGVKATYKEGWTGTLFGLDQISMDKEERDLDKKLGLIWFEKKSEAEALIASLPDTGTVISVSEKKNVATQPPKLFKLSTLQHEAGKLGYDAEEALNILESLYLKKFMSYPRTGCEYISSNEDVHGMLKAASVVPSLAPYIEQITPSDIQRMRSSTRWMNDEGIKKENEGHTGLCPTVNAPVWSSLSPAEQDIYELVARQFTAAFMPPLLQNKLQIIVDIGGHTFRSNGSVLVDKGFTVLFNRNFIDTQLPAKTKGDIVQIVEKNISEKTPQCPKRYTSAELIAVCEAPGSFLQDPSLKKLNGVPLSIGTPATRSSIIRKLIEKHKYLCEIKEKGRTVLAPTPKGELITQNLQGCSLTQIDLTGHMEGDLIQIRNGQLSLQKYESNVMQAVAELVKEISTMEMRSLEERKIVCKCARCGQDIIEGTKLYYCSGYKKDKTGCNIKIWKTQWNATFTPEDVTCLMQGQSIRKIICITKGNPQEEEITYDMQKDSLVITGDTAEDVGVCPICGQSHIQSSKYYYSCSTCGYNVKKSFGRYSIGPETFIRMLKGERIALPDSEAVLVYNRSIKRLDYEQQQTTYGCPACGKGTIVNKGDFYECPSCSFKIWKTICGHTLTEAEIAELCGNGRMGPVSGMMKKDGTPFDPAPCIIVDKSKKGIAFDFGNSKTSKKSSSKTRSRSRKAGSKSRSRKASPKDILEGETPASLLYKLSH